MSEHFYRAFEEKYRGSRELIKSRLQIYLPFTEPLLKAYPLGKALDVGCGRGEWLEVLTEQGFDAEGVDLDEGMLLACNERGLRAHSADAIGYLKRLPESSISVVSGFHIAEHLPFEDLQALVQEAKRVLLPGGLLILETPNPENIVVGSSSFYLDPTHQRPVPSELLSFLTTYYGFERSKVLRLQEGGYISQDKKITLLRVLSGVSPDYAVVAQKAGAPTLVAAFNVPFQQSFGVNLEQLTDRFDQRMDRIETMVQHAEARTKQYLVQLNDIYISRSWRITAPLRWTGSQLRLLRAEGFKQRLKTARDALFRSLRDVHLLKSQPDSYHIRTGKRYLLLDVSVIAKYDAKSGIQRVVRSILANLLSMPLTQFTVCPIYFDRGKYYAANSYLQKNFPNIKTALSSGIVEYQYGDIYLSLDLNHHLVDSAKSEHEKMLSSGVEMNFLVYDILLLRHPEWWLPGTNLAFKKWLHSVVNLGTRLICISSAVAKDVSHWLDENSNLIERRPQIASFHLGSDMSQSAPTRGLPDGSQLVLEKLQSVPTFLMVGTLEPRKGHSQVLDAFDVLWKEGLNVNLVIVGKFGWLVEALAARIRAHPQNGAKLFWLEGISDEYLEQVYKCSSCLIAASYAEGFGLPLIEAAHAGIAILARNLDVFREVAGEHAMYFAAEDGNGLAVEITKWLQSNKTGSAPSSQNMPLLGWQQSAQQLVSLLHLNA